MDKIFEKYPKVDKVYVTSDKNQFFKEHHAKSHAQSLEDKEVKVLKRKPKKQTEHQPNVEQRIALIEAMETVDEIKATLKGEKSKTVLKAGERRIAELTNNEE